MSARLEAALHELAEALRDEVRAETAPANAPDRLLSVDEAAALLGVGRSRLYDEIAARRVRSIKVGRRRLVPSTVITDYIAASRCIADDLPPAGLNALEAAAAKRPVRVSETSRTGRGGRRHALGDSHTAA